MKKSLLVALLILVVCVSAFAGSISFDTGAMFAFGSIKSTSNGSSSESVDYSAIDIPIGISYRQEIKNDLGVVGSFGLLIPVNEKVGSVEINSDNLPTSFYFAIKASCLVPIQKNLSFVSTFGINYSFGTKTITSSSLASASYSYSISQFKFESDLLVEYSVSKNFALRGGLNIGIPLFEERKTTSKVSNISNVNSSTISGFRMSVAPVVGVAYQF